MRASNRTIVVVLAILVAGVFAFLYFRGNYPGDLRTDVTQEGIALTAPESGQGEITVADNGKALSYPVGSKFTVTLDSTLYPENALSCAPPNSGVVRTVKNTKEVQPPFYVRTFEVMGPGTCTMTNTRFIAAIVATGNMQ
ncbi:hypothetical protein A3D71_00375 [Candidatus Kaiserbacteria bacterium RIFCSPHIGHO2_02_FULL_55_20]|uniref:Uncharacterized protein n=1 Tax=Candidatus Kaiserbacteria bacterium RIFCSPHIGHO2_02_FULL_55_20 TaxID=1798497 RepID=A0A1F6DX22_9BACT|nr:MAG: hypothetical protein A2680_03990 [Candidatus Kaiserbacteria bacterium RIFCSPHIGHO2_01_FULL_55_37]OGG65542.1 MAG: hypothetical protein A3D71_00375 [Candidatus Kaiserbacteria bacterium RIFCSPHIGHO2_02_FULL_55_20]